MKLSVLSKLYEQKQIHKNPKSTKHYKQFHQTKETKKQTTTRLHTRRAFEKWESLNNIKKYSTNSPLLYPAVPV